MSANLLVDLGATAQFQTSIALANSGPNIDAIVGGIVDLLHADTYCNVVVIGGANSGKFPLQVQCSDALTSGSFVEPTSGLAAMPTDFQSGGFFWVNSGLWASGTFGGARGGVVDQAPLFCSGSFQAAAFIRNGRYARAIALSGSFTAPIQVAIGGNLKTTGSGGGFTYSPTSGVVNV